MDITKFPRLQDIPPQHAIVPLEQRSYLVNGTLRTWSGPQQQVVSPICVRTDDGKLVPRVLGSYPLLDEKEAMSVLDAAVEAYGHGAGEWPTMSVGARIAHVEDFAAAMASSREAVINYLMWEIGKNFADSAKEFDRTVQYIKDTVKALKELHNKSGSVQNEEGVLAQVRRSPLGTVLCMGPFNYPLNETYTTLIPAVIMGNTVVLKPAKSGVLLHEPLLKAYRDCFPPGVINTVYGDGATVIGPMMTSGKVDVLAFIGSSTVADILQKQHPNPHHLEAVLGLDAKNPAIVLPDADMARAAAEGVSGAVSFNGQRCTALKMFFVHESAYDAFLEAFAAKMEGLAAGMPWEDTAMITPIQDVEKFKGYVADALARGGRVVNRGGGDSVGSLFIPAIVADVTPEMRIYQEEQFGPVVPVVRFSEMNEPLDYIRSSAYGQQVSIFGRDAKLIGSLIDPLANQVSRININSQCQRGPDVYPFTGRKRSAKKTLSVSDALRAFSIRSMVAVKESNKEVFREILEGGHSNFLNLKLEI